MTAKSSGGGAGPSVARARPDNAYYLLIGLAVSVTFITAGGLLIHVGYWPPLAVSNFWKRHTELAAEHFENANAESSPTIYLNNNATVLKLITNEDKNGHGHGHGHSYESDSATPHLPHLHSFTVFRVLGPILGVLGCILLAVVIVIGARINWEAVPDVSAATASASANFAKLRSELKLNILGGGGGGASTSKYELMVPIEMEARPSTSTSAMTTTEAVCSGSSSSPSASNSVEFLNGYNSNKIHIVEIL